MSIHEKLSPPRKRQGFWSLFWLCAAWGAYVAAVVFTVWILSM